MIATALTGGPCGMTIGESDCTSREWCQVARAMRSTSSKPGGFVMPHPPRDSRTFPTESGRAEFTVSPIEALQVPPGHLMLADPAQP